MFLARLFLIFTENRLRSLKNILKQASYYFARWWIFLKVGKYFEIRKNKILIFFIAFVCVV